MKRVGSILNAVALAICFSCVAATFEDTFDRPDSADIGNGWATTSGDTGGSLALRSGVVTALATDGYAVMCRPWLFDGTVTVTATVTDISGFGGVRSRFYSLLTIRSNGSYGDGYGIAIFRGDTNYNDSKVTIVDRGQSTGDSARSTFQFKERLVVLVRFAPNGEIAGSITEGTNVFTFSFGPRTVNSTGDNVAWCTGLPDPRGGRYTYPTLDDFSITTQSMGRATVVYSYDSLNRLTNAVYSTGPQESYTYDPAGNRLHRRILAAPDHEAPAVPLHPTANVLSSEAAMLSWDESPDVGGSGLAGYIVYLDGREVSRTTSTNTILENLEPDSHYCATVAAYDHVGNLSETGQSACFSTPPPPEDTRPPLLLVSSTTAGSVFFTNSFTLSVLLNLLATDHLEIMSADAGWRFAICTAVRAEAKKLRDPSTGDMIPIDIEPLIRSGVLHVLTLSGSDEQTLFIENVASLDDGEAMSLAIASSRHLELADRKFRFARRGIPGHSHCSGF